MYIQIVKLGRYICTEIDVENKCFIIKKKYSDVPTHYVFIIWLPRCIIFFLLICFKLYIQLKSSEAGRGAAARGVTAKPTGCGFDPHSRR